MNVDVRGLFHELADLPPAQREDHYRRRSVPDHARAELEALFDFDSEPHGSMTGVVGSAAEQFLVSNAPGSEGGQCGPYRLIRVLGHGGMGAVYLAERADGEVEQQVAIKFLRAGAELPVFRDRFLRERQILASLNHPGIARLIDAGHAGGRPYLVMEYVDGIRIDQYAAALDLRSVLALILKVAEAVAYAHRNLIIHRDLKPSNILIDASGQPKLLDFGIAKILEGGLGLDALEETRTVERMLTPEYASPEQLRGEAQATTTDVYSLGAVLYKLLTGQPPGPNPTLHDEIPKDLTSILNMAMREEPEERYVSLDLFIEDVEAFLAHRPVRARRGSALYMARKFVRRRWLPMAAGALAVLGLAGGMLLADRERAIAQRRFQQVRQLSKQFFDLDAEIRALPGSSKARNHIVSASLEYLERLGSEAKRSRWSGPGEQDLELALDIGVAYLQVARVQGVPGNSSLGRLAQARETLKRADSLIDSVLAVPDFSRRRDALFASGEIAHDSMILADSEHRDVEAVAFANKAAGRLDALLGSGLPPVQERGKAARIYTNLALAYQNFHRLDESVAYARRAVELSRQASVDQRPLSQSLGVLANSARFAGDFGQAMRAIQESRMIAEKMADGENVERTLALSSALWREGVILGELNNINLGRPEEALPLLQKAFDLAESLARRDPDDYTSRSYVSMAGRELGDLLSESDPARALAIYDQTFARLAEVRHNPKARRDQVWLLAGASYALRSLGRPSESRLRIDAALAILRDLNAYPAENVQLGEESDAALRALADHYAGTGRIADAIAVYEELLGKVQASNPQPESDLRHANGLSRIYRDLGNLHGRAGHATETNALGLRRLELWRYWDRKLPGNPFVGRQLTAARM